MWRPFLIALQFLTRLPLRTVSPADERELGRSLVFYPLVGLLSGLLLAALYWAIDGVAEALSAALLLTAWVLITGGLHLDGLADSADAWLGGFGDRDRTLAIMKDPCCGPAAVVALVVVLMVKFAALQSVLAKGDWVTLILIPVLGRTALPALFLTTPYVRPGGLGEALAEQLPRWTSGLVLLGTVMGVLLLLGGQGLWLLATATVVFLLVRAMMIRRLGGTTGDTAGALVELVETVTLVAATIA